MMKNEMWEEEKEKGRQRGARRVYERLHSALRECSHRLPMAPRVMNYPMWLHNGPHRELEPTPCLTAPADC